MYEMAVGSFWHALEHDPNMCLAYQEIGDVSFTISPPNLTDARDAFLSAISCDVAGELESTAAIHWNLSEILMRLGDMEGAVSRGEVACRPHPAQNATPFDARTNQPPRAPPLTRSMKQKSTSGTAIRVTMASRG